MKQNVYQFIINWWLIIAVFATLFTGLLIQVKYHMGNQGNTIINTNEPGINYKNWADIHKISIVVLSALMVYHIYKHLKWYKVIIMKKLISKNKQVIILSAFFILVAITGFIPWLIDLLKGDGVLRKGFIEIHDKLAIIFSIYLVLHINL